VSTSTSGDGHDETAIWGQGSDNGLVVVLRGLFTDVIGTKTS